MFRRVQSDKKKHRYPNEMDRTLVYVHLFIDTLRRCFKAYISLNSPCLILSIYRISVFKFTLSVETLMLMKTTQQARGFVKQVQ